jgi:hypothetical protein
MHNKSLDPTARKARFARDGSVRPLGCSRYQRLWNVGGVFEQPSCCACVSEENEPLWKPVRKDHIEEARKTDRMHIGIASGLLIVSVGTAASLEEATQTLGIALATVVGLALISLGLGLAHLLLLEKYLGHLAQQLAYSEAIGQSAGEVAKSLNAAWIKEGQQMPKYKTLRSFRKAKLAVGLAGLVAYAIFGIMLITW